MTQDINQKRDELLAIRCQLGEAAAFDELVERWHGPLWGYVRRLVGSDDVASDVVQDVWVRWPSRSVEPLPSGPGAWRTPPPSPLRWLPADWAS
jgi:DNA-directed RNA polymerase specialized sigma24 family protein